MDDLYAIRMRRAVLCSVLLHALILVPVSARKVSGGPGIDPRAEPILLRLQQTETPPPRQLVDVIEPSDTVPTEQTDLIAEENSVASDSALRDGETVGPQFSQEDPFDTLADLEPSTPHLPPRAPEPEPPEPPQQQPEAETPEDAAPSEEEPEYKTEPPEAEIVPERIAMASPTVPPIEMLEPVPEMHPSPLPPAMPTPSPGQAAFGGPVSKGRSRDAVRQMGLLNFEAIADQVAPYLKQVKLRVERRWNEALLNRYSGLTPTEAVVDCEIAPDGAVVSATLVGASPDPIFAALCRDAIVKAGPFGPFTFEVPDIYRNQNLEIRWTFSFL